ncbi:protein FAM43A-like [Limulus polyphemus]|uniref:Protein FAM43A-like n=1 Tax=Limulus polyphemus TaxID=6850 RepID=A0ABM1SJS3_LIMPO|nr:protein FAM43A-like [Limulus polyphemus]
MSISLPFSTSHIKLKLKFWGKRSISINEYDSTYKAVYLGNVVTPWGKGDTYVDMALATLWSNYHTNVKQDIYMTLTVCNSGLKAMTKEYGLTEYWANRITYCVAHPHYPRVFCWVYRHATYRLNQELRCHAILCGKEEKAQIMVNQLNLKLTDALQEFRREKLSRQKTRLSVTNSASVLPTMPRRKQLLITGTTNFRPPLGRVRSAPKLSSIEELEEEEEDDEDSEFEDLLASDSVISDLESSVDVLSDDFSSMSDQFSGAMQLSDTSAEEVIYTNDPKSPNSMDGAQANSDNFSTESGYSENNE